MFLRSLSLSLLLSLSSYCSGRRCPTRRRWSCNLRRAHLVRIKRNRRRGRLPPRVTVCSACCLFLYVFSPSLPLLTFSIPPLPRPWRVLVRVWCADNDDQSEMECGPVSRSGSNSYSDAVKRPRLFRSTMIVVVVALSLH